MSKTTTPDYLANEEEANYWFSVFDKLPDVFLNNSELSPSSLVVSEIKSYARAYQPVSILGREGGIIVN